MKLYSFLIALLFFTPLPATALTLAEMQQLALEYRPLVKRYETEIDKSIEDIRIARSGYYPSLDLGYSGYTINEATATEQRENSVFSGVISWNIFSGFRDKYAVQSAETLQTVESFRLQGIEQDIQLFVALRYLAVFYQKARLDVARDSAKTLESLYLDSKNRFDVGLLDQNAVLKFKVDSGNANLGVQKEEAELAKALHELSREINHEVVFDELAFEEFQSPPVLDEMLDYEQTMLTRRSELKVLEGLAESAGFNVNAEYSDYYPRFDLVGRYRNYDNSYLNGQGEFTDEELRAELVMSLNLFDGFSDEAEIARAKVRIRTLHYDLAELQNSFKTTLKNLFVDYHISQANVEVARGDITYAEDNLRITELKYREGLQRQIDLLDAVSNLTRAQSNYVAVVRTVFENYFRILRMIEGFSGSGQNSS